MFDSTFVYYKLLRETITDTTNKKYNRSKPDPYSTKWRADFGMQVLLLIFAPTFSYVNVRVNIIIDGCKKGQKMPYIN